jgi:hypothetical protein
MLGVQVAYSSPNCAAGRCGPTTATTTSYQYSAMTRGPRSMTGRNPSVRNAEWLFCAGSAKPTASYALPATNQWSFSRDPGVTAKVYGQLLFSGAPAGAPCGDGGGAGDEHQGGTEGGGAVL